MFDVNELLKSLNSNIVSSKMSYVYFDRQTGEIVKITNLKQEANKYNILDVPYDEVCDIIDGNRRFDEYKVVYDFNKSKYNLHKKNEIVNSIGIIDKIYEIPTDYDQTNIDILVTQDNSRKRWKVTITESGLIKLKQDIIYIADSLNFAITENGDPNILYEAFEIQLSTFKKSKSIEKIFQYDYSNLKVTPSVYTIKLFSNYGHSLNYE